MPHSPHLHHNAAQILRYFDAVLPQLEPGGGIPDTPMARKERGSSEGTPVPDYLLDLWRDNPHAGRIGEVLTEAAHSAASVELEGRPMWEVLGEVVFDHTAIRRWRAEGGVEMRRLWMMCRLLAQRLAVKHGGDFQLIVNVRAEDEQVASKRAAADKDKTIDAQASYRRIVRGIEYLEEHGYSREAAKSKKARDLMCSVPRIEKAITFVNRERENNIKNVS